MKLRKRLRKAKKVSERLPELVADKAASLNPLAVAEQEPAALKDVPQITTETIGEHREQVLSGARKYIYPLQHSKHRIVVITSTIIAFTVLAFLVYCAAGLYRLYQYNTFLYRVTQVVPFPIARTGSTLIDYENYLFELRHYVYYYQNHQQNLFGGKAQVEQFRKQALQDVISNAYVKILAERNKVKVSDREVDAQIAAVRNQNRLGSNDKVFADVLRDYWGWSIADFKRSLKEQMLATKLSAKLDSATDTKAQAVLVQLQGGADFGQWAKDASNAADAAAGGDFGFGISRSNPNVSPEVINQLFNLKPGQISDIILASRTDASRPNTLEILKVNTNDGTTVAAQHISFNLKDISVYVDELKAKQPVKTYVKF
ncbi:MAG: SurA N-terminal domain-containing protein [Patescibacteria group bacterium]